MECCVIGCKKEATVGMGSLYLCDEHWEKAWKKITEDSKIGENKT